MKVIDLVQDDQLHKLARRSDIRLGHEIIAAGEVFFGVFKPERVEAKVQSPNSSTRSTRLWLEGDQLKWLCTCTNDAKLFCKHLVATSVDAQREGRGDIFKVAGIILANGKMLVERSVGKPAFISPGGRIEPGETAKQALVRELKEEFSIDVKQADLQKFGEFSAAAANHPSQQVHMQVFVVKKWQGEITPNSEVEEILWLGAKPPKGVQIGSIFEHDVLPLLVQKGMVK